MERLKRLRTERGLSQAKLAARADLDPSTVNQIERGAREASPATLRKIAEALDVSLAELLEDAAPKAEAPPSFNDVLAEEQGARHWATISELFIDLRKGLEDVRRDYRPEERGPVFALLKYADEDGLFDPSRWPDADMNEQIRLRALFADLRHAARETGPGTVEEVHQEAARALDAAKETNNR